MKNERGYVVVRERIKVFFFRVRQDRDTDRRLIGEKIWLLGTEKLLSDLVGSLTKIFGASQGF